MSFVNDNGLTVNELPYTSDIGYISEGAVVGITFGWLVGVVVLYIIGMCLIRVCFRKYYD